jgi:hypothetical protein
VRRAVPRYRSEIRRLVPAISILATAATAGYLAGIVGPGSSLAGFGDEDGEGEWR